MVLEIEPLFSKWRQTSEFSALNNNDHLLVLTKYSPVVLGSFSFKVEVRCFSPFWKAWFYFQTIELKPRVKESWEALLDLTFQEDLCCTGPSFPLLLQVQTHLACCLSLVSWAVFTWSAAFCEFSQTLNCWWYQLDSFSVWGIVQNCQSYLAVMWARNEFHLWFRTKDDSDSMSDWQWVRTRSAIHWVEQEVFLQRFWALPPFEGRLLAGLRFCQSLQSCFCFLLIYEVIYCSFKENKSWHLCFHFVFTESRALVALHCEVLSFVSLIGRTMYFHSRSLFWLVCCIFRTNFTRAFFHV